MSLSPIARPTSKILTSAAPKLPYLLTAAPVLAYWLYWTLNPSYWFNADPAAWYFLDSLGVFAGKTYAYVDHPGTPMHLLGSLLLALTYPFLGSAQALIDFYIAKPEAFFLMAHVFLLAMNLLCVLVFYKTASRFLKNDTLLGALSLSLAYFALHPYSFPSLNFWSHNSFNFPLGTLWLLWLFNELSGDRPLSGRKLAFLGFVAGALAITQIYFITWLVGGLAALFVFTLRLGKPFKAAFFASFQMGLGGLLGVISMLAPIYKEIPRFVDWLTRIILHQGLYGTGESGVYTLAMIPFSLTYWWATIPLMMLVLALVLVLLAIAAFLARKLAVKIPPSLLAMTAGMLVQAVLLLAVMSKAVLRLRYSLSLAALLPLLLFIAILLLEHTGWKKPLLMRGLYAALLIGVLIALGREIVAQQKRSFVEQDAAVAKSIVVNRLAQKLGVKETEVVVVYTYATPLKCGGLIEAGDWIGSFEQEIKALCPNQYAIYDTSLGIDLNTPHPLTQLSDVDWDLVVWPGNGSNLDQTLYAQGIVNVPASWGATRAKWFFIHPEDK